MRRNYYDVLGVAPDATTDEVRAAYVSVARRCHPDVNREPDANQQMAELNLAYETLSDHDKRLRHDAEIALRDPADQLKHSQAVALAAAAASFVADYCPDPLVAAAIDAAEVYALRPLPSSAFLASQAVGVLTRRIFAEPAVNGPADILAADSAAKAARAAAAAATAPHEGAEAWAIESWRGMNASWLGKREGGWTVETWGRSARKEAEFAVIEAFRRVVGARPTVAAPGQRELQNQLQEQWSSWIDLLLGGMTAGEFLQRRTVNPALQEIVESTLREDVKPCSHREMKGELIPISKVDRHRLETIFAAQGRLVDDIKRALNNPLDAIFNGLKVTDSDQLLDWCVQRYKDDLPVPVLVNTVFDAPFAVRVSGSWWTPPYVRFGLAYQPVSLRTSGLLDKEDFKVRWDDDGQPFQIVIQAESGPASFQISDEQSDFPAGDRIEVYDLLVRPSAAFFSRNKRYSFELHGWG